MAFESVVTAHTTDHLIVGQYPDVRAGETILSGLDLARGTVVGKITVAAGTAVVGTNTGDGVLSGFALAAGGPAEIGNYLVTCVTAAANSGTFEIVSPSGVSLGTMVVAETPVVGGITFTIADGAADFIVGDVFTLPVAEGSLQIKVFDVAATDGAQIPFGVLMDDVDATAAALPAPIAISGKYNIDALIVGGSTDLTDYAVEKLMRDANLYMESVADAQARISD